MFLRSFKLFVLSLFAAIILVACGGDSAPAPTDLVLTEGENSVTATWTMSSGVEYWIFYGPTSIAPSTTDTTQGWIGLPGGAAPMKVSSPYVVTGLVNGTDYAFTMNGRTSGGPGGPGAAIVKATPRAAGSTWVAGAANSAGTNDLRSVTYGGIYVAAGAEGASYSSPDGVTWTALPFTTTNQLNGANFYGTYKLVGDAGTVLTSSDAVTWTQRSSGTTKNLYAIANNGASLNVAVGEGGAIITSPDGITWTAATNSATISTLYGVTYGVVNSVGTWIAVGAGGTMISSTDGLIWKTVASTTTQDLQGVTYGTVATTSGTTTTTTPTFVAVGAASTLLSSTDGAAWATGTAPVSAISVNSVAFGTQFVAAGSAGNVFVSADGLNWTASSPTGTTNNLFAVTRGLRAYSAVGAIGTNLLSK